jgi:hypothetical protein
MKEDEVENILNNCNLIAFTEKTITSIERIRVELKKIRKTGFSFYDREYDKYLITRRAEFHGLCPWVNGNSPIGRQA